MKEQTIVIKEFEGNTNEESINSTMRYAYANSKRYEKTRLDFDEVIWDKDVTPITETLRRLNIKEFTISSCFTGLISVLAAFEEAGIKVQGMVKVETNRPALYGREGHEVIPAILMKVI